MAGKNARRDTRAFSARPEMKSRKADVASAIRMVSGVTLFSVASAFVYRLLENNPARDWVDVALYVGFTGFMLSRIVFSIQQSEKNSTSAFE